MLQDNKDSIRYMNKRIVMMFIDYFLFVFLFGSSFTLLLLNDDSYLYRLCIVVLYLPIFFILYYGVIVKLTNGSTLGGLIVGLKIVGLKNEMNIFSYLKRFLYAFFIPIKLLTLQAFKVNYLGQLYFDEKFKTIVIDKKTIVNIDNEAIIDNKYFEYIYAFKFLKFFGKLFLLFVIVSFFIKIFN